MREARTAIPATPCRRRSAPAQRDGRVDQPRLLQRGVTHRQLSTLVSSSLPAWALAWTSRPGSGRGVHPWVQAQRLLHRPCRQRCRQVIKHEGPLERDYGWSRICIEPNPRYHDRHQAVRTCRLLKFAVADTESNFQFRDSGEVGGLVSKSTDNKPDQQGSTFPVRTVPFKGSFSLFFFPLPPCGVCRSSVPSVINYRRKNKKTEPLPRHPSPN